MIIGLSGYIKSGKDTVGQIIQELITKPYEFRTHDDLSEVKTKQVPLFTIKKFAEKLKEVAAIITGVPRERFEDQEFKESYMPLEWNKKVKTGKFTDGEEIIADVPMTYREFLQKLGTDAVRNNLHKDTWVNSAIVGYDQSKHWLFTDCRFPNEAKAIKDKGGIIIRINRYPPGCSPVFMDRTESEVSLDDWHFDYTIYNIGSIDDLRGQVKEILKTIVAKEKKRVVKSGLFEEAAAVRDIEKSL